MTDLTPERLDALAHGVARDAMLLGNLVRILSDKLDEADGHIRAAKANLMECGHNCDHWCRALDRLIEALRVLEVRE